MPKSKGKTRTSKIKLPPWPYERNKQQNITHLEDSLGPDDEVEIAFHLMRDPLAWHEAEEPALERFPPMPLPPEFGFHEFLCGWRQFCDNETFKTAYRKITAFEKHTPIRFVPEEPRIVLRIVLPLRHAKAAFVLGNYFSSIALSGVVAEMVAILIFEIEELKLSSERTKGRFKTFEAMGQELRVEELKDAKVLTKEQVQWFGTIRTIRRKALHFLGEPPPTEKNATDAYRSALGLLATTLGIPSEGTFGFNPKVIAMLERRGFATRYLPSDPDRHKHGKRRARVGMRTY